MNFSPNFSPVAVKMKNNELSRFLYVRGFGSERECVIFIRLTRFGMYLLTLRA